MNIKQRTYRRDLLPDSSCRVRARLQIRFREGLDLPAVKRNYSRLDWEAGDFHRLDLFLGNADARWDVLASWVETATNETRYDVWCSHDPAERAVRNAIAELSRRSEDGFEIVIDEPNGFLKGLLRYGPALFGVRRGSITKTLQLAEVLPWSRHRIDETKLLDYSDSCIDLLGRDNEFAQIDSQCIVVLAELFVGRSVRLTENSPPNTNAMDTARKGTTTLLYWGR
jgi:hypothetical protein